MKRLSSLLISFIFGTLNFYAQIPSNDCISATDIGDIATVISYAETTTQASTSTGIYNPPDKISWKINDGAWFKFITTEDGYVTIKLTNYSGFGSGNPGLMILESITAIDPCDNILGVTFTLLEASTGLVHKEDELVYKGALFTPFREYYILVGDADAINDGTEGVFKIEVNFSTTPTLNIDSVEKPLELTISPNPSNGVYNVNCNDIIEKIEVYNLLGQKVSQFQPNVRKTNIDISNFNSGIYMVKLETNDKKFRIYRIVKN